MILQQVTTPGLSIHSYVIADVETRKAAVVDPPRDVASILKVIQSEHLHVAYILETHVHADFISGAKELQAYLGDGCIIACSAMGGQEWIPAYAQKTVRDGDCIRLGALRLEARHTPGHTPEHLIWIVYDESRDPQIPSAVFSGDFLLVGSIGRPDLIGESQTGPLAHQLYRSTFSRIADLPDFIQLLPAHGSGSVCGKHIASSASSTLGYERHTNPLLESDEEAAWVNNILKDLPSIPGYFPRMKQINIQGAPLQKELPVPKKLTIQEMAALNPKQVMVCDVRMPKEFAAQHLSGSVNFPLRPAFSGWAADLIPQKMPVYLLLKEAKDLATVLSALRLVGIDAIHGYTVIDSASMGQVAAHTRSFPVITPAAAAAEQASRAQGYCILDVRTPVERRVAYIANSKSMELSTLPRHLHELPKNTSIAVICRSGYRASVAASLLRRAGFEDVSNIQGGMEEWTEANLPLVRAKG